MAVVVILRDFSPQFASNYTEKQYSEGLVKQRLSIRQENVFTGICGHGVGRPIPRPRVPELSAFFVVFDLCIASCYTLSNGNPSAKLESPCFASLPTVRKVLRSNRTRHHDKNVPARSRIWALGVVGCFPTRLPRSSTEPLSIPIPQRPIYSRNSWMTTSKLSSGSES